MAAIMGKAGVLKILQDIVRKDFSNRVNPALVVPEARLKDIDVDSLTMVEITLALEEALKVSVPDEAVDKMRTVQDVVDVMGELCRS